MEKTELAAVIPADIGWSDVGSWTALDDVSERDASGNVISGNVIDIGSHDSIIYAEKRLVATIGLKDVVVVDTPDATLVCRQAASSGCQKNRRRAEKTQVRRASDPPHGPSALGFLYDLGRRRPV